MHTCKQEIQKMECAMRTFSTIFRLLVFLNGCKEIFAAVSEIDMFTSLEHEGATQFSFTDDTFLNVDLGFTFNYSNKNYTDVYIGDNGIIVLEEPKENITWYQYFGCRNSPSETQPTIAPFWTDVRPNGNGTIYYQTSTDPLLLQKASEDVLSAFQIENLDLTHVFIVTWEKVRALKKYGTGENTFQAILTTDGSRSFVLFYFHQIQWPIRSHSYKASTLFINTEGVISLFMEYSCTDQIKDFVVNHSNIGDAGKWVFQVDPIDLQLPVKRIEQTTETQNDSPTESLSVQFEEPIVENITNTSPPPKHAANITENPTVLMIVKIVIVICATVLVGILGLALVRKIRSKYVTYCLEINKDNSEIEMT